MDEFAPAVDHMWPEGDEGCESSGEEEEIVVDREAVSQHSYLEELECLTGTHGVPVRLPLPADGSEVQLPLLMLKGLVVLPSGTMPLLLTGEESIRAVETAMRAKGPLARLLAVTHVTEGREWDEWRGRVSRIGTCLELVKAVRAGMGMRCLARGRLRVQLELQDEHDIIGIAGSAACASVRCTVRNPPPQRRIPAEASSLSAHWPPWAYRGVDPQQLAAQLRAAVEPLLARKQSDETGRTLLGELWRGDPERLSWWLPSNLPISAAQKQQVLDAHGTVQRLQVLLRLVSRLLPLCCAVCCAPLGRSNDMVSLMELGASGVFVNPHGHVHDIVTLREVQPHTTLGDPETEFSWFPGYAWTSIACRSCSNHIGWHFSEVSSSRRSSRQPAHFYGIRRDMIRTGGWSRPNPRGPHPRLSPPRH